ncbi:MAG: FkbM family methyltransferase [Nitrososphaeraceae archaeon]
MHFLLNLISKNKKINYLDIGANHPFYLSNTALLYKYGGSGTLVEPDPYFAKLIRRRRSKDKVLECGVHFSGDQTADFYIMDTPSLNTFSKTEMQRYEQMGHKLKKTIEVNLMNINDILQSVGELDFVNLDIEGLDFEIIKMINWEKYRPKCICVETLNYEKTKEPVKSKYIIDYMISKNYILYADTFINSIFVDKQTWEQHWSSIKSL